MRTKLLPKKAHGVVSISRSLLMFFVAAVLILSLTACSSTKPTTSSSVSSGGSTTPKKGGILTLSHFGEPAIFGTPWSTRGASADWSTLACEPLLTFSEKLGVYEPVLAESWDWAADYMSITFHLRKGVKFHDGTDFNAQAVAWNWQKRRDYQGPTIAGLSSTKDWTVIDDYTIRFNLRFWTSIYLDGFYGASPSIISPTAFDKNGGESWTNTHPVGTGPFIFKDYSRGQYLKFERNPNYWKNNGTPYLDEIDINVIKDTMVAQASLINGDIDVWREADIVACAEIKEKYSDKFRVENLSSGNMILYFNSQDPASPWSNLKMRQALEYAIDKDLICTSIGKSLWIPNVEELNGISVVGKATTTPRKYDPVKAKQLMTEAGYANGLSCKLVYNTGMTSPAIIALQNMLAKVNIELTLDPQAAVVWSDLTKKAPVGNEIRFERESGGPTSIITSASGDFGNTSLFYVGLLKPDGWQDTLDKLLASKNADEKVQLITKLDSMAYDNAMIVPLWKTYDLAAAVNSLKYAVPAGKGTSALTYADRPTFRLEYAWLDK